MADFIELTELYLQKNERGLSDEVECKRIFNKYLITDIKKDERHNQSYITYEGKEVRVRESFDEINAKSAS